jgi:hypothetical protein
LFSSVPTTLTFAFLSAFVSVAGLSAAPGDGAGAAAAGGGAGRGLSACAVLLANAIAVPMSAALMKPGRMAVDLKRRWFIGAGKFKAYPDGRQQKSPRALNPCTDPVNLVRRSRRSWQRFRPLQARAFAPVLAKRHFSD